MKIFVTGGAGYSGAVVVRHLLQQGYEIVCVDNLRYGGESLLDLWTNKNLKFIKGDVTDFGLMKDLLSGENFQAVIHLAAIVGDPACKRESELAQRVNWDSSRNLYELASEHGISRFIFASTCSNYGKMADPGSYVDETSPLAPISLYAELKVKFEELLLNTQEGRKDFCPTSLRFATIYGMSPRMRFDLTVNEFTKELSLGHELNVYGENFWRPYCHVQDYARAVMSVLQAPKETVAHNVFNVGDTRENYTKKMIVDELLKVLPESRVKYTKVNEDPRDYRVSFQKIKSVLGFEASHTVPEEIKLMVNIIRSGIFLNTEDQRFYNIPH